MLMVLENTVNVPRPLITRRHFGQAILGNLTLFVIAAFSKKTQKKHPCVLWTPEIVLVRARNCGPGTVDSTHTLRRQSIFRDGESWHDVRRPKTPLMSGALFAGRSITARTRPLRPDASDMAMRGP